MTAFMWAGWAFTTLAWNAVNSLNSRAKNSTSWRYNAVSTMLTSLFYILSMAGIGNALMQAHGRTVLFAAFAYAVLCSVGSVVGQEFALKYLHNVERGAIHDSAHF